MDLSVIIVSFNTKELLDACLQSVFASKGVSFEVIVVDNASTDGSAAFVTHKYPKVRVIDNKNNVGFAKANNQGMKTARGERFLLLNSDTKVFPETFEKLVAYARSHNDASIIGCQILSSSGIIKPSAGYYPSLLRVFLWMTFLDDLGLKYVIRPYHVQDAPFFTKDQTVDWVQGACMLIPKRVYERVGGLDEDIFMYGEDVEYGKRVKDSGFNVLFCAGTRIIHIGQGSSGKRPILALVGEYQGLTNMYRKRKGYLSRIVLRLLLQWGAIVRYILFGILGGSQDAKDAYTKSFAVGRQ